MQAAVASRSAPRALALLSCRRSLLGDPMVRSAFSEMFSAVTFQRSKSFLEAMRIGGVNFSTDFPEPDRTSAMKYQLYAPIGQALDALGPRSFTAWADRGSHPRRPEPLAFLVEKRPGALAPYPHLAGILVDRLLYWSNGTDNVQPGRPFSAAPPGWDSDVRTLRALRLAGLPVDADDHAAYRSALHAWLAKTHPMPELVDRYPPGFLAPLESAMRMPLQPRDERTSIDPRWDPLLADLAAAVAPTHEATARRVRAEVAHAFFEPRLTLLDAQIAMFQEALDDPKTDEHAYTDAQGNLRFEPLVVPLEELTEDTQVLLNPHDASRLYTVRELRARLDGLRTLRARMAAEAAATGP